MDGALGWESHAWFGQIIPLCLMAAFDDATGKLLVARFFAFEGSSGYLGFSRDDQKVWSSDGHLSRIATELASQ